MDWKRWFDFFQAQHEQLRELYLPWNCILPPDNFHDAFTEIEFEHEDEVERIIRQFAKIQKWPKEMSREVGALVRQRVEAAQQVAFNFRLYTKTLKIGHTEKTDAQWIRWFLIDAWKEVGYGALTDVLINLPKKEDNREPDNLKAEFGRN